MSILSVLQATLNELSVRLEHDMPVTDVAHQRAAFDQLRAEARDTGVDPFIFGALTVTWLMQEKTLEPWQAMVVASMWYTP